MVGFPCAPADAQSDDLIQAWRYHLSGEFAACDALFAELCLQNPASSVIRLKWARSFRFRGHLAEALTLLASSLQLAQESCSQELQVFIFCEMAICSRLISDPVGHSQSIQSAIKAVLSSPEPVDFPEELLAEWRRCHSGDGSSVVSDYPTDGCDFIKGSFSQQEATEVSLQNSELFIANELNALSDPAGISRNRRIGGGDFYAALLEAEQEAATLLHQRDWEGGLRMIGEVQRLAEQLELPSLAQLSLRWKARLKNALGLLNALPHRN